MIDNKIEILAKPLVEYLKENCNPYTKIEITEERILVLNVTQGINVKEANQ